MNPLPLQGAESSSGFMFPIKLSSAADPFQMLYSSPGTEARTPHSGAVTMGILCRGGSMVKGHPRLRGALIRIQS